VKKALLDLNDDYDLAGVAPETAKQARDTAKQIIAGVLQNENPRRTAAAPTDPAVR
jgi:hypothetical protein